MLTNLEILLNHVQDDITATAARKGYSPYEAALFGELAREVIEYTHSDSDLNSVEFDSLSDAFFYNHVLKVQEDLEDSDTDYIVSHKEDYFLVQLH